MLTSPGHFGCVYRGLLRLEHQKEEEQVAVKTLKAPTGKPQQEHLKHHKTKKVVRTPKAFAKIRHMYLFLIMLPMV